jgi:hypothetical protein
VGAGTGSSRSTSVCSPSVIILPVLHIYIYIYIYICMPSRVVEGLCIRACSSKNPHLTLLLRTKIYLNIRLLLMPNMFDKQDGHKLDGFSALYISSGQRMPFD